MPRRNLYRYALEMLETTNVFACPVESLRCKAADGEEKSLMEILKSTGKLPVSELLKRYKVSRKLIDRHRKFILASILIKNGDYNHIESFMMEG